MALAIPHLSPGNLVAMQLVENKSLAAAATNVVFSDLNGDADIRYMCIWKVVANGAAANYTVQPNGVTSNQQVLLFSALASGTANFDVTSLVFHYNYQAADGTSGGYFILDAAIGYSRPFNSLSGGTTVTGPLSHTMTTGGVWRDTSTLITSLELESGAASGFGIGSKFSLYRIGG